MSNLKISELTETTTAPDSSFIPIDDGETTKKITVENFNLTGTQSAQAAATAATNAATTATAAATTATNKANDAETARTQAVTAKTAAETAQGYAEAAQSAAESASSAATAAKNSITSAANACAENASEASTAATNAETYKGLAKNYAESAEGYGAGTINGVPVIEGMSQYQNNAPYYAEEAGRSADIAMNSAIASGASSEDSEAYALGTRVGEAVPSTDPTYHNNSKYYAEQAASSASQAASYTAKAPYIGANGHWYVWDSTNNEYVDSNVEARGDTGDPGVSPEVTISSITGGHTVSITDEDHPQGQSFNVMDGIDGTDGQDGTDGTDGVSPTVTISTITGGHSVNITDKDHPSGQSFDVTDGVDGQDGEDGTDGVSPEVTITSISGGNRVTITDKDHPQGQSFDVLNGSGSGDMLASTYDPNSAVATAGGIPDYVSDQIGELNIANGSGTGSLIENDLTNNVVTGSYATAEGFSVRASGNYSHAEGNYSVASGYTSHAEGVSLATGQYSHSQNNNTTAQGQSQTAIGTWNVVQGTTTSRQPTDNALIIGNGTNANNRSNALAVQWDGTVVFQDGSKQKTSPYSLLGKLGAKNLIPCPYLFGSPYTQSGITFTVTDNGAITVNGTAEDYSVYYLMRAAEALAHGDYIVSATGLTEGIQLQVGYYASGSFTSKASCSASTPDVAVSITDEYDESQIAIRLVVSTNTVVDNVVVYPMLRYADDTDNTYQPYAMTNKELTDAYNSLGTASTMNVPLSGNASSSEVVKGNDSRLTDSRTPTAHTHSKSDITDFPTLGTAAAKNVPASGNASTTEVVMGDDSRLSDARTPISHSHAWSEITSKPFSSIASNGGLTVTNNELKADVKSVSVSTSGTASSTGARKQQITINGTSYDVGNSFYMEQSATLSTSADITKTFTNAGILSTSRIDVYTSDYSIVPSNVVASNGSCTVTIPKASSAASITVGIEVKN